MKNKLQPARTSFSRNFQCKEAPRWLSKSFLFGTENRADQLKKPPCRCSTEGHALNPLEKGETNYILTIKNKMYRIRNLIEIFIFDKGGPSWIFPLEVKKYAALMVFETFLMRTPERIKSKAKKERRLRTILVRNTTWLWLSRPKISPSISQHFLVQLSSPFKSLHFKSRFHWYHSSTFHVSFLRGTFYLSIESSSHRYLVSETDCGIYWLIYMFIFR